jgi:heme oxygenase
MAIAHPPGARALAALETATASLHADAEADVFRVLDDATGPGYRQFLSSVFHFEYPVELQLTRVHSLPLRFVSTRLKTGRLGDDLLALGPPSVIDPLLAQPLAPPTFRDGHDALAWLYVVQRNTLHHTELYRALAPRLRTTLQTASRYLTTHASDVYKCWHELGAYLDRVAGAPEPLAQIIEVARDAFRNQHAWYARALARRDHRFWAAPPRRS